jgi:hypothetical protein
MERSSAPCANRAMLECTLSTLVINQYENDGGEKCRAILWRHFTRGIKRGDFIMRVYFMRDGHIAGVEFLNETSDDGRIAEAATLFESKGKPKGAEGFEVWDGARFVYRFPPAAD